MGGLLRYGVPESKLPRSVLDAEIAQIQRLGVEFHPETVFGKDVTLEALQNAHDAVVLALGAIVPETFQIAGLNLTSRGIAVRRNTYETSLPGVFAGGNAISERRRAIRCLAHGKEIACSVDQFLRGLPVVGESGRFDSRLGKLLEGEREELLQIAGDLERVSPKGGRESGFDISESIEESSRCFQCDCRKADSCRLRLYADEYGAEPGRFKMGTRRKLERITQHGQVIYEPGKCIKCGLCIQIARREGEELGLPLSVGGSMSGWKSRSMNRSKTG